MARLTGKVALITGAAGGQGAAEAEPFVRREAAVLQFRQWNIRVNSIHPGQTADTGFFHAAGEAFAYSARTAIPMQRQGTTKECAEFVLFLAADESSFISGAEIAIDDGYIAAGLAGLRNRLREDFVAGRTEAAVAEKWQDFRQITACASAATQSAARSRAFLLTSSAWRGDSITGTP